MEYQIIESMTADIVGQHSKPIVHFVIQAPNLAQMHTNILRTPSDTMDCVSDANVYFCLLVTCEPCKTDKPIEVPFGVYDHNPTSV